LAKIERRWRSNETDGMVEAEWAAATGSPSLGQRQVRERFL
jgi:hypothetical protein